MNAIENKDFETVEELGEMPPDTIITEEGLAKLFCRHPVSIRRAVERPELPPAKHHPQTN
jgi:hypothetical protein